MTTDISVVRGGWDPTLQQEIVDEYEYDGGNSSSRLFERSRIKALAGTVFIFPHFPPFPFSFASSWFHSSDWIFHQWMTYFKTSDTIVRKFANVWKILWTIDFFSLKMNVKLVCTQFQCSRFAKENELRNNIICHFIFIFEINFQFFC